MDPVFRDEWEVFVRLRFCPHGHSKSFFIFFSIYYLIDFLCAFCGEDSGLSKREGITCRIAFSWAGSATLPLVFSVFICYLRRKCASLVCADMVPRRNISRLFFLPFLLLPFSSFSSYSPSSPSCPFSFLFILFVLHPPPPLPFLTTTHNPAQQWWR